ncbi:hypothetical protein NIASO_08950 [Niabella soli DSM 19437]|uniref:Uncharacterized protein n=1 Tax=Niabella soli DSM 19437 TaxID=929713 RepID=W0F813_9BACT|nr:hypothetical protein NIASO_08950 [Niabella soli DSM 19437]
MEALVGHGDLRDRCFWERVAQASLPPEAAKRLIAFAGYYTTAQERDPPQRTGASPPIAMLPPGL